MEKYIILREHYQRLFESYEIQNDDEYAKLNKIEIDTRGTMSERFVLFCTLHCFPYIKFFAPLMELFCEHYIQRRRCLDGFGLTVTNDIRWFECLCMITVIDFKIDGWSRALKDFDTVSKGIQNPRGQKAIESKIFYSLMNTLLHEAFNDDDV